jgi:hypothetical protein
VIALSDYQFEINGVVFGKGCPVAADAEGFDTGVDSHEAQDAFNAFNDSLSFGRDAVNPSQWAWAAHTDKALTPGEALEAGRQLGVAWNDRVLRQTPGAVAALRYCIDGRTRVVYGRPRSFAQVMSNQIIYGVIPMNLEFQRADTLHYGDELHTFSVSGRPSTIAGFKTPIKTPLTTIGAVPTTDSLPGFGGDAPAPFEATFTGGTNPKLFTDAWEIQLDTSLADEQSITVSTYPWGIRAIRDDGARMPGVLSMKTRLSKARLDPAGESLRFSVVDSSGRASCTIAWRTAHTTI